MVINYFINLRGLIFAKERDVADVENMDYLRLCTCLIPAISILVAWVLVLGGKASDYNEGDSVVAKKRVAVISYSSESPSHNYRNDVTQTVL